MKKLFNRKLFASFTLYLIVMIMLSHLIENNEFLLYLMIPTALYYTVLTLLILIINPIKNLTNKKK